MKVMRNAINKVMEIFSVALIVVMVILVLWQVVADSQHIQRNSDTLPLCLAGVGHGYLCFWKRRSYVYICAQQ